MWGRVAAPEENRETDVRPHLTKSGLAFRGRCNGPPQGLVCPPPGLESPGPSLPAAVTLPVEEAVSEGKGLNISPQAGRREAALNNRTRPLGAPHPSLFDMSRTLSSAAATESRVSSQRSNRLHTSPSRGGMAEALAARHPGESRGPVFSLRASGASWIPASAGMTTERSLDSEARQQDIRSSLYLYQARK
jgi:hypothetical protein